MMRSVLTVRRRAGRERAQVALEAIIVIPVWLVVITLFINLLLYLGSAMLMQSNIDRAAFNASAVGCVTSGLASQFSTRSGFGVHDVSLTSRYLTGAPLAGDANSTYYQFNKSSVLNADGTVRAPSGTLKDATCSVADSDDITYSGAAPSGDWIFLQARYTQNLWVFGHANVVREALSISHTIAGS